MTARSLPCQQSGETVLSEWTSSKKGVRVSERLFLIFMTKWAETEYCSSAHHVENSEPGYHNAMLKDFIHIARLSLTYP